MQTARIEVKDLVVRYAADVIAVNGVSFTVGKGEHVTLLGPSGCGKTTTLRTIAGLETPSGGSIHIDGRAMFSAASRTNVMAEQRGVSMVFQSYAVWPHMTVFDNVAYGLRVRKQSAAAIKENVDRALGLVQMRHLADRPASKLSGGQQQRVALARAIAFSPTVVLFDEPLSNLDAKLRAEMRVELRELLLLGPPPHALLLRLGPAQIQKQALRELSGIPCSSSIFGEGHLLWPSLKSPLPASTQVQSPGLGPFSFS